MIRVFFAHRKDSTSTAHEAEGSLRSALGDVQLVLGADDYAENFARCGGWDAWCADVAVGCYYGGAPRYHAFVVPDRIIGRATYAILDRALDAGKPVWLWEGVFFAVTGLRRLGDSWKEHAEVCV